MLPLRPGRVTIPAECLVSFWSSRSEHSPMVRLASTVQQILTQTRLAKGWRRSHGPAVAPFGTIGARAQSTAAHLGCRVLDSQTLVSIWPFIIMFTYTQVPAECSTSNVVWRCELSRRCTLFARFGSALCHVILWTTEDLQDERLQIGVTTRLCFNLCSLSAVNNLGSCFGR
ncbi:hypothetical protein OBBRIDRAFT_274429 [Obba rivulosa]|uniref:Uncharacterized protein n=1 Tax=Obba rivulosa TaxID=1052685 RepID=A0A8E2DGE7_9APHY|nr:hypothetical protein OBBRIDRAFT_274429 [Obba rivulosa]